MAWFYRATEQALEGGDLDAVLARSARALGCGATGALRGALLAMAGYVHTWRTQYAAAALCYQDALVDLPRGGASWYLALGGGLDASASTGDFVRMQSMVDEMRAGLRETSAPITPVQGMTSAVPILCIAGQYELARDFIHRLSKSAEPGRAGVGVDIALCHYAFFAAGDPWALRRHALTALAHGERMGEARVIHMAQTYEAIALVKLGAVEQGEQLLREVRASAASLGLRLVGQFADPFLADVLTNRGALDEATALLEECREHVTESALWGAVWAICSARVARRRRHFDAARSFLRSALAVCDGLSPGYYAHAIGLLGTVEQESGADPAVSVPLLREALRRLDTIGTWYNDVGLRVYAGESLHLAGDRESACAALADALAQIEVHASAIEDEEHRRSYLEGVMENVRAAELAREWGLSE